MNRVKGRKTSRDENHFPLARATNTVHVLECTCSREVAALQQPLARPKSRRLMVHVHVRVGRRAQRVFALFPRTRRSSLTDGSSQDLSKSLSATALLCEKYDNCFFFSVHLKLKKVHCKAQVNLPILPSLETSFDMGFAAASTVDIWAPTSLGWKKLVLSLFPSFLSLSPSLFIIYENTLEVHRILLRCQTFSNSKLSPNCAMVDRVRGIRTREQQRGFGWDTVTAGQDHAKLQRKDSQTPASLVLI